MAGLGISCAIILVGVELLKSSIEKIINPEESTAITLLSVCILIRLNLCKAVDVFLQQGNVKKDFFVCS